MSERKQEMEIIAHAYVVDEELEDWYWGSDPLLPDDPSLVLLTDHTQATRLLAGKDERIDALMAERANLIETKWLRIDALRAIIKRMRDEAKPVEDEGR